MTLTAATRNRGQGRRAAQSFSGLRWAEQRPPWWLQLPLPFRRARTLSVGELWPLAPLLAYITPGSLQRCSLGPDPHFVLLTVALNLFSLRSSSCHSINSAFFEGLLSSVVRDFPGGSDGIESAHSVRDPGGEDPLEKGTATHSSILAWRIPVDRGAWWATVHGVARSGTQLSD